jgi:AraC-like DNA-binding protein
MAGFRERGKDLVDLQPVPYPAVTVVIDLGGGLLVDDTSGQRTRGSLAAGLAPGDVRVRGQNIECLQIRLSPMVAHAVLGGTAELSGTLAGLEDLWGRDAERAQDQLRAAGSWEERFTIAEATLARRHQAGRVVDPEVAFAWRQMVTSMGQVRVEWLAAETGWSRNRLWSRFRAQVGLTPKRAARLIRFDRAAHRLAAGDSAALVAAETGYADQSHLSRDVVTFAGATPRAVADAAWLAVDDIAWADSQYPPGQRAVSAGMACTDAVRGRPQIPGAASAPDTAYNGQGEVFTRR